MLETVPKEFYSQIYTSATAAGIFEGTLSTLQHVARLVERAHPRYPCPFHPNICTSNALTCGGKSVYQQDLEAPTHDCFLAVQEGGTWSVKPFCRIHDDLVIQWLKEETSVPDNLAGPLSLLQRVVTEELPPDDSSRLLDQAGKELEVCSKTILLI